MSDNGKNIELYFDYDADLVRKVRAIPGRKFVPPADGHAAFWRFPLDLEVCRALKQMFGQDIGFTKDLVEWGRNQIANNTNLRELGAMEDVELEQLPELLPDLAASLRNYQRVGVKFLSASANPLLGDHPGLGKTRTAIGAVFESQLHMGPQLVVAPKTSLETVWMKELNEHQDFPVFVPLGGRRERLQILEEAALLHDCDEPFWLVVNPAMIQFKRVGYEEDGTEILEPAYPMIGNMVWNTIIFDEVHKAAVQNPRSLTARAAYKLKATKKIAMSGTPVGGAPIKLWGILHWLHPNVFTSKWRWAMQWLEVEEDRFGRKAGKIQRGREEAFYKSLQPYLLRRTKAEVAPELPPKQHIEIWVEMEGIQYKQYRQMHLEAEVEIEDERQAGTITATGILAKYTRLKQFADAHCVLGDIDVMHPERPRPVMPTETSNKLEVLLELLEERGITGQKDDEDDEGAQVVIFSQFSKMVDMVCKHLEGKGIATLKITGAVGGKDRLEAVEEFQSGQGARVIVMTTTAGGVAITLDRADTVIFLDETWVPDDQEQAEDRVHRVSRIHQVTVYFIRSKDSIEAMIQAKVEDKANINNTVLDLYRQGAFKIGA